MRRVFAGEIICPYLFYEIFFLFFILFFILFFFEILLDSFSIALMIWLNESLVTAAMKRVQVDTLKDMQARGDIFDTIAT